MTGRFIAKIPDNPRAGGHYLSIIAYPRTEPGFRERRFRFLQASVVLGYKAHRKHLPPELRHWRKRDALAAVVDGERRIERNCLWCCALAQQVTAIGRTLIIACETMVDSYANRDEVLRGTGNDDKNLAKLFRKARPILAMAVPAAWVNIGLWGAPPGYWTERIAAPGAADELARRKLNWTKMMFDPSWVPEAIERAHGIADEVERDFNVTGLVVPRLVSAKPARSLP